MKAYAALILAGGFSSRMGSFKPLLPLGGTTVVERLISTFRQGGLEVVVVAGHRSGELIAAIASRQVRIVDNADFARGMFSSVQAGLAALGEEFAGVFIAPVDIPLVRSFTLQRLLSTAPENPDKIIYPVCQGRRGHPPLLPAAIFPTISAWPKEGDLKSALESLETRAVEVAVADRFIHADLDTPEDYERLKAGFERREIPSPAECEAILDDICRVSPAVRRHGQKVAGVGEDICLALQEARVKLDLEAVVSAALLHDLAKGRAEHELAAAALLGQMGFSRVGSLVAAHTELGEDFPSPPIEAKILFLADKLVSEDKVVELEERFARSAQRFAEHAAAAENIRKRLEMALKIKREIESATGRSLMEIVSR